MPSFSNALLIGYLIYAIQIWYLVLKKSAYPENIPTHLKWIHAFILLYVLCNAFHSFFAVLLWLVFHPSEIVACFALQLNQIGNPSLGIAGLTQALAGTFLLLVCGRMAKRQKSALKWYFILWPLMSISSTYIEIRKQGHFQTQSIVPMLTGMVFVIFVLFVTTVFYLQRSTQIIFEEQKLKTS
jgi:hypothetical protein